MISLITLMKYSKINTFWQQILEFIVFGLESGTYRFLLSSLLKPYTVEVSIGINDHSEISCKWYTDSLLPFTIILSLSDPYFPHRKMLGEMWSDTPYLPWSKSSESSWNTPKSYEIRMRSSVDQIWQKECWTPIKTWKICMDSRYCAVSSFNVFVILIKSTFKHVFTTQ